LITKIIFQNMEKLFYINDVSILDVVYHKIIFHMQIFFYYVSFQLFLLF